MCEIKDWPWYILIPYVAMVWLTLGILAAILWHLWQKGGI